MSASEGSGGELSQPHRATTRERTVATLRAGLKEEGHAQAYRAYGGAVIDRKIGSLASKTQQPVSGIWRTTAIRQPLGLRKARFDHIARSGNGTP